MRYLEFNPGIYWRGIRITYPVHSVVVRPGLYIVPFAPQLIHLSANVGDLKIDNNVSWVCWNKYCGFLWFPKVYNNKSIDLRQNAPPSGSHHSTDTDK